MEALDTFTLDLGEGLRVRPLEEKDAAELIALIDGSRRTLRDWLPWVDTTRRQEDSLTFIRNAREQYENSAGVQSGIWHRGKLAGVIGYGYMDMNNRRVMIGYWLAEPYRGRGLMTRACAAMTDLAFTGLLMNRVEIHCAVDNHKSRAIPERLGFRREGVLRQYSRVNDHYDDIIVYCMLASEWPVS